MTKCYDGAVRCYKNITGVVVIDMIINYNKSSETVSVQRHGREFDGILPNIRLSMPNDEY